MDLVGFQTSWGSSMTKHGLSLLIQKLFDTLLTNEMSKSSWLTKLPSPGRLATCNQQLFSLPARNRPTRLKKKFLRLTRFYYFFSLSWICVFSTFTLVATSHAISSLKKCCYEIEKNLKFMWPVWQHHYWQTCSSFNLNQTMCRDFETFHLNRQRS